MSTWFSPPRCEHRGTVREQPSPLASAHVDPVGGVWVVDEVGKGCYSISFRPAMDHETDAAATAPVAPDHGFQYLYTFDDEHCPYPPGVVFTEVGRTGFDKDTDKGGISTFFALLMSRGADGHIAIFRTVVDHGAPPTSPIVVEERKLFRKIACATATGVDRVALACSTAPDGFGEVVALGLASGEEGGARVSSLFRIPDPIASLAACCCGDRSLLVSISRKGNVDVWDVDAGRDVTESYGNLHFDVAQHGLPTSAAAVVLPQYGRLWVGTEKGLLVLLTFSTTSPSSSPIILPAHRGPVVQLVPVCFGTELWSLTDSTEGEHSDEDVVCVWDAEACDFAGSFVFPEGGLRGISCGPQQCCFSLIGTARESGRVLNFAVSKTTAHRALPGHRDDPEGKPRDKHPPPRALCNSASGTLNKHLLVFLQFISLQLEEPQSGMPPAAWESLHELLAANHADPSLGIGNLRYLPDALDTLAQGRALLQSEPASSDDGDGASTFLGDLRAALARSRQAAARERELLELLPSPVNRPRGPSTAPASSPKATGEDRSALAAAAAHSLDTTPEQSGEGALCQQLKASQRALAQREERIRELEASLLTAQRAAQTSSTVASLVSDMEAKLHATTQQLDDLQREVAHLSLAASERDLLREQVASMQESLEAYKGKETVAQLALRSFLDTQNAMADEVGVLASHARRLCADLPPPPGHGHDAHRRLAALQKEVDSVEDFVKEALADQQDYFLSLKAERAP